MGERNSTPSDDSPDPILQGIFHSLDEWLEDYSTATTQAGQRAAVGIKLLKSMVQYAPILPLHDGHPRGQAAIIRDIVECEGDKTKLKALAAVYRDHFLVPVRAAGGRTSKVTDNPSRLSDDNVRTEMGNTLVDPKRDQERMKRLALERDGGKCVITHTPDIDAYIAHQERYPNARDTSPLVLVHILPFSLNKVTKQADIKQSSPVWTTITMFSGIQLNELHGTGINRIENVMMLTLDAHTFFGQLNVWLEPVESQPNRYRLKKVDKAYMMSTPQDTMMDLDSHSDGAALLAPDPRYLRLHAACAKIVRASGAAKYIDEFLYDYESLKTLGNDGSHHYLLEQALSLVATLVEEQ
ncbi:hypothetical protein FRB95_014576 [Tulasnella sp. JGI-2019a]|nr:hypothetical protein FRB95_014576 [Tulasnella sp. JGI-2019a]